MNQKLAITATNILQGLGQTTEQYWQAIQQTTEKWPQLIDTIQNLALLSETRVRRMDRVSQLLSVCIKVMLGKIDQDVLKTPETIGMCTSTFFSSFNTTVDFISQIFKTSPTRANPMDFANASFNVCTGYACMETNLKGYNNTIGGFGSLAEAFDAIQLNRAEAMVVAGIDQAGEIQKGIYASLSESMCLAEGAAALFLEKAEAKRPLAWYLGYSTTFDAQGLDKIDQTGQALKLAIQQVLEKNKMTPDQIDAIVLSTGTVPVDHQKYDGAIEAVFKGKLSTMPFYHLEASCGYTAGAAEVLAINLSCQIFQHAQWPGQAISRSSAFSHSVKSDPFEGHLILVIVTDQFGCQYCHLLEKPVK